MVNYRTITSSRADVKKFLADMKAILCSPDFDIEHDFFFQEYRLNDDPEDMCNNSNTMLALDYSASNIVEELKTLEIQDYSETVLDSKKEGLVPLYVFGRVIKGKEVYIKVRIKSRKNNSEFIFCLSFHFAKHPISTFPYA